MQSFAVHVHTLTRTHISHGEHQQPLLTRLREAIAAGTNGGNPGGGEGGAFIPVNPAALDLFCKIETQARMEHRCYRGFVYVGPLENLLRDLIGTPFVEMPEDWNTYLTGKASEWVDDINGLLYPKKPRRRLHRPCPACGVKYQPGDGEPVLTVNCWDEDEVMVHPSKWDAACSGCGAEWHGDDVQWLAHTLVTV